MITVTMQPREHYDIETSFMFASVFCIYTYNGQKDFTISIQ